MGMEYWTLCNSVHIILIRFEYLKLYYSVQIIWIWLEYLRVFSCVNAFLLDWNIWNNLIICKFFGLNWNT